MLPIRIGASPWQTAVSPCLDIFPHTNSCLKKPGIELETLTTLLDRMQIAWVLKIAKGESGCGYPAANWTMGGTGLFGMLARNEVDITGNVCGMESPRTARFDFTSPVYYAQQVFVMKIPKQSWSDSDLNDSDLGWPVWSGVIGLGLLVAILLSILEHPNWKDIFNNFILTVESYTYWTDSYCAVKQNCWIYQIFLVTIYSTCIHVIFILFANGFKTDALVVDVNQLPFQNAYELARAAAKGNIRLIDFHKNRFPTPLTYSAATRKLFKRAEELFGYEHVVETPLKNSFTEIKNQDISVPSSIPLVHITKDIWFEQVSSELFGANSMTFVRDNTVDSRRYGFMMRRDCKYVSLINTTSSLLPSLAFAVRKRYLKKSTGEAFNKIGATISTDWKPLALDDLVIPFVSLASIYGCCALVIIMEHLTS